MDHLRGYLLTVIAAAIISGIAVKLIGKKGLHGTLIQLLTGLFLSITVISPLARVKIDNFTAYLSGLEADASAIIADAEKATTAAKVKIIKEEVETYILDEAKKLGLDLEVTVTFASGSEFLPDIVNINGAVAPYKKRILQDVIQEELGIPEEKQMWK